MHHILWSEKVCSNFGCDFSKVKRKIQWSISWPRFIVAIKYNCSSFMPNILNMVKYQIYFQIFYLKIKLNAHTKYIGILLFVVIFRSILSAWFCSFNMHMRCVIRWTMYAIKMKRKKARFSASEVVWHCVAISLNLNIYVSTKCKLSTIIEFCEFSSMPWGNFNDFVYNILSSSISSYSIASVSVQMCFLIQFIQISLFFVLLYFVCRFVVGSSVSLYMLITIYPSNENKKSKICWKSFAVAIVIASLAGPQWLLTEEKIRNLNYNGTSNFNIIDDGFYITKYTKSSLWILCFAQGNCFAFLFSSNLI